MVEESRHVSHILEGGCFLRPEIVAIDFVAYFGWEVKKRCIVLYGQSFGHIMD